MKAYHGTTYWKVKPLLSGKSSEGFGGLYVTDTPERAQLYADAQASGEVDTALRYVPGAAVVEMEIDDSTLWYRREPDHPTLDKVEACVQTWTVTHVTVYVREYDIEHGSGFKALRATVPDDMLTIIVK